MIPDLMARRRIPPGGAYCEPHDHVYGVDDGCFFCRSGELPKLRPGNRGWPEWWAGLTAREVFDALKSAPKVAGPWTERVAGRPARFSPDGGAVVHSNLMGTFCLCQCVDLDDDDDLPTKEAADARLRELGWLLVDDDQTPAAVLLCSRCTTRSAVSGSSCCAECADGFTPGRSG